jgi:hypothetical protein
MSIYIRNLEKISLLDMSDIKLYEGDVLDTEILSHAMQEHKILLSLDYPVMYSSRQKASLRLQRKPGYQELYGLQGLVFTTKCQVKLEKYWMDLWHVFRIM